MARDLENPGRVRHPDAPRPGPEIAADSPEQSRSHLARMAGWQVDLITHAKDVIPNRRRCPPLRRDTCAPDTLGGCTGYTWWVHWDTWCCTLVRLGRGWSGPQEAELDGGRAPAVGSGRVQRSAVQAVLVRRSCAPVLLPLPLLQM